jgi:RNA polymerase sigma factor (sigma-70 family)
VTRPPDLEELVRGLAPGVLGTLVRRYRDFEACEDALQEALLAALVQWAEAGVPSSPRGWLLTVASRRLVEEWRRDSARRRREALSAVREVDGQEGPQVDDSLQLLLLCCHPAVTPPSQVAITLRAVGGLTTAEIARAYLVPEATMAQRISRAKQQIRVAGARFATPSPQEQPQRVAAVLKVLYLIFTEGHTASSGGQVHRVDLCDEAIRLTRLLHAALPDDGEVLGLLALMLLTDARRPARTTPAGDLVPLAEQDRALWEVDKIQEGTTLITEALTTTVLGPYQVQAAIAAVHAEAADADTTDWDQILALYDLLLTMTPGPMVTLNRIVALSMKVGARAALTELDAAERDDPDLAAHYRAHAVRAYLLEQSGDPAAAARSFQQAARGTLSAPERRYLTDRANLLAQETQIH